MHAYNQLSMCKLLTRILRFLNERFSAVTAPLLLHRMYFVLLWYFHQSVALIEHKSWQVDSRPISIGACSVVLKKERRLSQPWQQMVSILHWDYKCKRHRTDSTFGESQWEGTNFGEMLERLNAKVTDNLILFSLVSKPRTNWGTENLRDHMLETVFKDFWKVTSLLCWSGTTIAPFFDPSVNLLVQ